MSLQQWVSDKLIKLTGVSSDEVVDYVISLAQRIDSPSGLKKELQRLSIVTEQDDDFSLELYNKTTSSKRSKTSNNASKTKKNTQKDTPAKYIPEFSPSFEDSKTEVNKLQNSISSIKKSSDSASKGKTRSRTTAEDSWESNEAEELIREENIKRAKFKKDSSKNEHNSSDDEDEYTKAEKEMEKDALERDEFDKRLKEKDKSKTKKIVQDSSLPSTSDILDKRSLANNRELRNQFLPDLRERSRQQYLNLREEQQLELLEREIKEEEFLFSSEKLTEREMAELEYKKKVLSLAKERKNLSTVNDGYSMPEDYITEKGEIDKKKKEAALFGRYIEPDSDATAFISEQEQWEKHQIEKSLHKPSKKIDSSDIVVEKEYDYVLDTDAIDFVMEETLFEEAKADELHKFLDQAERKRSTIKEVRDSLPIFKFREQLLDAVENFPILIIVGETGSGKTTQLPQYLYEAGYCKDGKKVGCTQPRRVAAMSVAARVAEETGTKIGHQVGYSIRFEDCTSDKTRIKYMTDGMLLREFMTEPDLAGYSCLMIDEAHERTLHTDILFALVKDIARFRPDLKLLISSATMDAQKFSEYFDDAPIFKIPGRPYPVEIYNTKAPEANYLTAAVTTVLQIHASQPKGDILVFLTGQDEIEQAMESLKVACRALGSKINELIVCPIYSNLPSELQAKIFDPTPDGSRKVILATNIAETSITIDGIVYVIDPGFVKQNSYNPRSGIESLQVVPCSRASASQRSGRAGRVGPGKCFRLYTQHAYMNELDDNTAPEILRVNLSSVVLTLKCLGINNLIKFDFMDPPSPELLKLALEQLYALGALNDKGEMTKMGRRMAEFPMDPMMSRALLASEQYNCANEMATIISMLSVSGSVFYRPKDKKLFADRAHANFVIPGGGDHLALLNCYNQFVESGYNMQWCNENFIQYRSMTRARDTRDQLIGLMERVEIYTRESDNIDGGDIGELKSRNLNPQEISDKSEDIRKSLTAGFFFNSAKLGKSKEGYSTVKRQHTVYIHPSSNLFEVKPTWILYFELVLTSKEYMRQIVEIDPKWLVELAPHFYSKQEIEDSSKKKMPITKRIK
ncbi:Pre-mRNA-splicing factor ATP-dependent RNA helicase-like protein cdc28 [Smittium culicis]|uniref:RNA helicase n=1 Tax=Smittium culicis TaxID=133412 RepID=A0A1R1YRX2_9FUNG|nr:Pre-mRNA-splicing factor ATP-dependent RNA helicase-like protein cdc28 [Smittium culicis]